jgi:hypothetical protein
VDLLDTTFAAARQVPDSEPPLSMPANLRYEYGYMIDSVLSISRPCRNICNGPRARNAG